MLDGRVKTMHPKIAGGILAMRGNAEHMRAIAAHGIAPIDMVVVNLYRFRRGRGEGRRAPRRSDREHRYRRPTMLRAAAKNYQDVASSYRRRITTPSSTS